jgi:hypothetical protein
MYPHAAANLAAVATGNRHHGILTDKLTDLSRDVSVNLTEEEGQLILDKVALFGFLQIPDRRRYRIELTDSNPEQYLALSRRSISA